MYWLLALAVAVATPVQIIAQTDTASLPVTVEVLADAPKPATDLRAGTATYKARIELIALTIGMDITRTVKDLNGTWLVTETAAMAQDTVSDEVTLEKGTLQLQKRLITHGDAVIDVRYSGNRATGTISRNGQDRPISADLGGVLFADGAGSNDVIAALPLTDGYTASYRNFDVMSQQVRLRQIRVVGSESVTVPAGTFDTWKVETTAAGGTGETVTLWVDKRTRLVAKSFAILPRMNGAVATAELVKSD